MKFSFILRKCEITAPRVVNIEFVPEIDFSGRGLTSKISKMIVFFRVPSVLFYTVDYEECFYRNLEDFVIF